MKKAIFLFDRTGIMAQPWLNAGVECWIFDGQHETGVHRDANNPLLVRVGMWFDANNVEGDALTVTDFVKSGIVFVASFAECTYLTSTGARWFYHPDDKHLPTSERRPHPNYPNRRQDQKDAVKLARLVEEVASFSTLENGVVSWGPEVPWMLENPAIGALNTKWRRPDHKFHPNEYGGYLPEDDAHPLYPEVYPPRDGYNKLTGIWCGGGFVMPERKPVPGVKHNPGWAKCGGKSLRTKNIRSCTPRGFAQAVFDANYK